MNGMNNVDRVVLVANDKQQQQQLRHHYNNVIFNDNGMLCGEVVHFKRPFIVVIRLERTFDMFRNTSW